MGTKIAVIGGGSTYTPELVDGLARRTDRLPIDELVLLDIEPERLEVVGGLAQRMLARAGWGGRLVTTLDRDAAVDGADFVLIQLRVGGQAARLVDETLPPKFGTIGQETTGAGGFAKALRTVPLVLELAELTRTRAANGAWIVDFTNPVGVVSQALLDREYRAIGLCNVAITLQRMVARRLGVDPDRVALEHVGLNHLSWERAARVDGVDRLPDLIASDGQFLADDLGLPLEQLQRSGVLPSYYLRYFDRFDEVLRHQQEGGETRASEVMEIERQLLELYRDPKLDRKPALLDDRGGAYYSEAAAQLIASLHDGRGDVQVVDVRNEGAMPDLEAMDVVEVAARIDRDGAHPLPVAPLADDQRELVLQVKRYERLTIEAAMTGDRTVAREALEAHPLVDSRVDLDALLDALLDANRRHLPQFFPAVA
ncbi:MAG: 6-phospho-beta-glucosidase [Chloroflexi bacterium]|nr:MAG: 6-phospho-beta-glucosidase [Chloroflexota bacterium]